MSKKVIDNTKQPHEYLVRSIQSKETQLKKQQVSLEMMQKKIEYKFFRSILKLKDIK